MSNFTTIQGSMLPLIPVTQEQYVCIEPAVLQDGNIYRGLYTACIGNQPNVLPRLHAMLSLDGERWFRDARNPVIGGGSGNWSWDACCASFRKVGSQYHSFFANGYQQGDLWHAISDDGVNWWILNKAVARDIASDSIACYNNDWIIDGSGVWWMLCEFMDNGSPGVYRMKLLKSFDGGVTFGLVSGYLDSLRFGNGCHGGPCLWIVDGVPHLWYHASYGGTTNPSFPTFVAHAKCPSGDFVNWIRDDNPLSQVTDETFNGQPADQHADVGILDRGSSVVFLHDVAKNKLPEGAMEFGDVRGKIWNGTLASLAAFVPPAPPVVIDNGDAGFSTTGPDWLSWSGGYGNDHHYAPSFISSNRSNVATWQFSVGAGLRKVYAEWNPHPNRATDAPYRVYDGSTLIDTVRVNQELPPSSLGINGVMFKLLGEYVFANSPILTLANDADEWIIAGAAAVQ